MLRHPKEASIFRFGVDGVVPLGVEGARWRLTAASSASVIRTLLSDMSDAPELVEHHHRQRAQIEERIKDHKLGVSLKHLPASDQDANRTWLFASSLALNLLAMLSDLTFGPDPDERLPRRRQAKYLRRMLLCVPARVIHHARQVTLRLPAGLRWANDFARAYTRARGLPPPLPA